MEKVLLEDVHPRHKSLQPKCILSHKDPQQADLKPRTVTRSDLAATCLYYSSDSLSSYEDRAAI